MVAGQSCIASPSVFPLHLTRNYPITNVFLRRSVQGGEGFSQRETLPRVIVCQERADCGEGSAPGVRVASEEDEARVLSSATWILLSPSAELLQGGGLREVGESLQTADGVEYWTDDSSNLWHLLGTSEALSLHQRRRTAKDAN